MLAQQLIVVQEEPIAVVTVNLKDVRVHLSPGSESVTESEYDRGVLALLEDAGRSGSGFAKRANKSHVA